MARRKRIEFEGALYHVLNRGNYRAPIFRQGRADAVFQELLLESCEKYGWELHAFTIMKNHFHLALGTPRGQLSAGMQWLQSTFANRFNRYVQTPGHVFQGRFKAILVEPGPSLLRLVNYIHLNPVQAGVVPLEHLDRYRLSSFFWFLKGHYPEFLKCDTWLTEAGSFSPGYAGMKAYWKYLDLIIETDPIKASAIEKALCNGSYIGSDTGRKGLIQKMSEGPQCPGITAFLDRESLAGSLLSEALHAFNMDPAELRRQPKGIYWKCALARLIHHSVGVSNAWLAKHLHMGHPAAVSRLKRRSPRTRTDRLVERKLERMFNNKA